MVRIKKITAREILDSRGYPTVAADVLLDDGNTGTAEPLPARTKHLNCATVVPATMARVC